MDCARVGMDANGCMRLPDGTAVLERRTVAAGEKHIARRADASLPMPACTRTTTVVAIIAIQRNRISVATVVAATIKVAAVDLFSVLPSSARLSSRRNSCIDSGLCGSCYPFSERSFGSVATDAASAR